MPIVRWGRSGPGWGKIGRLITAADPGGLAAATKEGAMAGSRTVAEYIADLGDWRGEIVAEVRAIIRAAAPEAREAFKWSQPVYESNGPFAYIKAFPRAVNIGFWRGVDLEDPAGLLEGDGARMRHLKLTAGGPVHSAQLAEWVRQAVALNLAAGDPTKRGA